METGDGGTVRELGSVRGGLLNFDVAYMNDSRFTGHAAGYYGGIYGSGTATLNGPS